MRSILFSIFLISYSASSQIDYNKSIKVPSLNAPVSAPVPAPEADLDNIYVPSFGSTKPKSDKYKIGGTQGITFGQAGEQFGDPGEKYVKKLNQKQGGESSVAEKGNQYFGDFKNNGDFVNIKFRDFGLADGDLIKISVNDAIVVSSVMLSNDFRVLDLPLKAGFNKIDFEALNQGYSGPNTAEFHVFDDKGKLIAANQWNLATGFKATVIIVKEKEPGKEEAKEQE
ncbi:MAG TPA: hypothetical protein VFR70_09330 [Flavobacterium sp.]|nr:hypothetical protein [Flavobacterium sp.]